MFLAAEINTLEDFKKQQTALEVKVKGNNERMAVNEEKVKEVVKIINRKFEFDKEMYMLPPITFYCFTRNIEKKKFYRHRWINYRALLI